MFIAASLSTLAFGQRQATTLQHSHATTRTTAFGDTRTLTNINASDSLTVYTYGQDSGYVTGTNAFGDLGFAERYDINGTTTSDSSVVVIGVMAQFGGHVSPTSTQSINFKIWGLSNKVAVTSSLAYNNFPMNGLDTLTVLTPYLGMGPTVDTMKSYFFPRRTDTIQGSFFVGYNMSYSFSSITDTFGLYSTLNGARTAPWYQVTPHVSTGSADTVYDTVINVQNATLWSDNIWHENYTQNDSIKNNLAIFPIVIIGHPTGISSVTKNSLTFFGNYPNPASDYTNVKFSLARNADVTIKLMDLLGRTLNTVSLKAQGVGEHLVTLPTTNLAAGNYIYSIITSTGDAIASQLSVVK